ncbi:cyclopropane-fatty-acyl-phospholipid synthase [bacterium]|nr:cyclopropane-fatty-acyl-phospholipid synthase [bacterium]|tara:strand:+ start:21661 stop:22776 length:1116 start_codon:yes stop_codon:yes gene_type:complete
MGTNKKTFDDLLEGTGVTINGNKPYDPQIKDGRFYTRVLKSGTLGLGESYMDGWWECDQLDELINKVLRAKLDQKVKRDWKMAAMLAWQVISNTGRKSKAFEIGEHHYDAGNDLYKAMLDKRMVYTCGYWENAENLDRAQEAKLDLVCKKIGLKDGQSVLDIGSGWGSFIGYAAEKYKANATGLTVSKEQKELADSLYKNTSAKTLLKDYRDIDQKFDHVVSLGMFEHVGYKNYRTFMKTVHGSLKDDGLFLLHTIGGNKSVKGTDPWYGKYIFPNSMLPSVTQIGKSIEGLFVMEDWHNFGSDYDKTLMAWHKNFKNNWDTIKSNYDERFYRMWEYYLLLSAGAFRARKNQLWQVVLSKKGVKNGYKTIR